MPRLDWDREDKSNYLDLIENAKNYRLLATFCFYLGLWAEQSHLGHIAIELAYKAVFSKKNSGWHPHGHDLSALCSKQLSPSEQKSLFDLIKIEKVTLDSHTNMKSVWDMQDRYRRKVVSFRNALMQYKAYRRLLKWLLKNCV